MLLLFPRIVLLFSILLFPSKFRKVSSKSVVVKSASSYTLAYYFNTSIPQWLIVSSVPESLGRCNCILHAKTIIIARPN